jgi:ribonuclease G
LPWFRWLKKETTAAQTAAPEGAPPASEPAAHEWVEDPPESDGTDEAREGSLTETEAQRRRRRRGSRGGRNRKKKTPEAGGEANDDAEPAAVTAPARRKAAGSGAKTPAKTESDRPDRGGKRSRPGDRRRKQPPRRAPLPAAERELLISVDVGEQRVAVLEDGQVAEVYLERPERRSIAGNIYLGVVDNVLPGMEAAFVEIGLEKNGFLYVDEIVVPELEGKRQGKKITDLIQRGQQILVQAVKDPMKTKGARLTTEISLPGRFLVYVPYGEGLGVSRRLDDNERQRLKEILKELDPKQGGIIVRTAAQGASAEDIERDLVFLQRLWKTIQARAKAATTPELVYQEAELPLRIVRDLFAGDFLAAHVDDDRAYKRIVGYLKKTSPHMLERVHRDKEKERLFDRFGVAKEIASTLERRVDLPSGGYLIFDYAEAFTVIDVNTGRFVGSRSKNTAQRLEDTIVKNNLEAVKEVVRQLRLRDIGGIIVIDFIDMANPKNRHAVEEALRTELERDRTKTYVVEISPLGLVEMTRQNVTDGPREVMTRRCPTCAGDGIVVSEATAALEVERRLRELAGAGTRVQAYRVAVHPRVLPLLAGPGGERLAELEERLKRRFFLVAADGHAHTDHLEVLAEGKLADLQPQSSLQEGAELEVKLAQVGLHDAGAGVAKVDGVDVVVADAAKLVGKKALVTVGRVLEGQAFASIVAVDGRPTPITFESEAEKPTRAPARRRTATAAAEALAPVAVDAEEEPELTAEDDLEVVELVAEDGIAPDEDAVDDDAEGAEPATPRKKTRRGSRGGKRRKKPAASGAATDAAAPADDEPGVDAQPAPELEPVEADGDAPATAAPERAPRPRQRRPRQPKIHVPATGLGEAEAAVDGGDAAPAAVEVGDPGAAPESPDAAPETADGNGAAPVALEVKKKTRRGSRGGRNRRKKPVGATDDPAAAAEPTSGDDPAPTEAVAAPVAPAAPGEAGYVPMSEWLDDFKS